MSYVVLARKYRPMRFEDLVGQEHVARTLGNAIAVGRVAHAFLFTGVRGVGKTTSARILAKALNCTRKPGSVAAGVDPGPTATPCLQCSACLEITAGNDLDVREIDGASYNGVDEVRKLQDALPYRPARDRFKIFIVDEVHMLSQSAWNAFLKTLEEPPPHVKFIFATTEVQKVPVTILSRVQRFDFKLISAKLIGERLRQVLGEEQIVSDDRAIAILAREAAGSMRDAMSLLDQVIAWGGAELRGDDVARVLGVASHQVLYETVGALIGGDPERCLGVIAELANQGYDIAHVARDLLKLLRDVVVAKVCKAPDELLDLADDEKRDVTELAAKSDTDDLLRLHQGFSQAFDDVIKSGQQRAALEMLLVRLARRPPLLPIDDLVGRLASLERRLAGGGPRSGSPSRGPIAGAGASEPPAVSRPRAREAHSGPSSAGLAGPRDSSDGPPAESSAAVRPVPVPAPTPPLQIPPEAERSPRARDNVTPIAPARARAEAESALEDRLVTWRSIVDRVRESRPELAAFLEHAAPLKLEKGEIVVGWEKGSIFAGQASTKESLALLTHAAGEHFGAQMRVTFELDSAEAKAAVTVAAQDSDAREQRVREALAQARQHPRISDAMEILGARLKDVKLANE
jgi:DNA polymerase III subunit gamma/tau